MVNDFDYLLKEKKTCSTLSSSDATHTQALRQCQALPHKISASTHPENIRGIAPGGAEAAALRLHGRDSFRNGIRL